MAAIAAPQNYNTKTYAFGIDITREKPVSRADLGAISNYKRTRDLWLKSLGDFFKARYAQANSNLADSAFVEAQDAFLKTQMGVHQAFLELKKRNYEISTITLFFDPILFDEE
jgi:hypothetical protein